VPFAIIPSLLYVIRRERCDQSDLDFFAVVKKGLLRRPPGETIRASFS
jgi:hypothetical protein